jgi:hypothetical protein
VPSSFGLILDLDLGLGPGFGEGREPAEAGAQGGQPAVMGVGGFGRGDLPARTALLLAGGVRDR